MLKICCRCKNQKKTSEFYKNIAMRDALQNCCKLCSLEAVRKSKSASVINLSCNESGRVNRFLECSKAYQERERGCVVRRESKLVFYAEKKPNDQSVSTKQSLHDELYKRVLLLMPVIRK